MLRRAVQKRPYDWEPLLPAVLQAYRSTPSESTGFTPSRLVFGREMHLPVDIGIPLPEPPRDIRTYANILSEDLEWAYKVAREVIGTQHKRAETRYNDHVVEKLFKPGDFVRVLQHGRNYGAQSKLVPHFSGLCEVLAVRGPILTLRELDTRREFTANHDAVRLSSLTPNRLTAAAAPLPDATDRAPSAPLDAGHRAQSPTPSLTPPQLPAASPVIDDYALLAPPPVAAPQHQAIPDAQLDADARPQRRRNPPPYLDDYVVSPFQRAYNVKCAKILDVHSHISDDLQSMPSSLSHLLLDVHSSQQSNHDVSLQPNTNANDDITIGFIYTSNNSVPSAVPSYWYCVTSSLKNNVKSSLLPGRLACTPHRSARRRRRPRRHHRTPRSGVLQTSFAPSINAARYQIRFSSPKVDAVCPSRGAARRSLNLSDGELVKYGASIGFATI